MIHHLLATQESVSRTARSIFPAVEDAHDDPTADLLTQRTQAHQKAAWMLPAACSPDSTSLATTALVEIFARWGPPRAEWLVPDAAHVEFVRPPGRR